MRNRMEELARGLEARRARSGRVGGGKRGGVVFAQAFDDGGAVTTVDGARGTTSVWPPVVPWDHLGTASEAGLASHVEAFQYEAPRDAGGAERRVEAPTVVVPPAEVQEVPAQARSEVSPPPPAPPQPPQSEGAPAPKTKARVQAPEPAGAVDEDSRRFAEGIEALIQQAQGRGSPESSPAEPAAGASAGPSVAQSENPHAIFDRMDMSMANVFSGGAVDVTPSHSPPDEERSQAAGVPEGGEATRIERFDGGLEPSHVEVLEDLAYITSGDANGLPAERAADLSGAQWRRRADEAGYTNSTSLDDLAEPFRSAVKRFHSALVDAGASVALGSTKRDARRAWLMHHAWRVADGEAPPVDDPYGIGIVWDHGDAASTRAAAAEMRDAFNMKHQASLTSRHISGNAVDWDISWQGDLVVENASGEQVTIAAEPRNGENEELQQVGASYGVHKLASDPPHWSDTGH